MRKFQRISSVLWLLLVSGIAGLWGIEGIPQVRTAEGSEPAALTFAVIGDYGVCGTRGQLAFTCTAEKAVAALVHSWRPEAIFTTGDNTYGSGSDLEIIGAQRPYSDYINVGKFFPAFGNHDWATGTLEPSLRHFRLKTPFYKREFAGLLTAYVLDTNPEQPAGNSAKSGQAKWLRTQLVSSSTPWNVAFNHQAAYASCGHRSTAGNRWVAADGIDMVFSGHTHAYERHQAPNYSGSVTIPYIVVGASGAPLVLECRTVLPSQQKAIYGKFGAVKLEITATTLTATFYDITGSALDSVSLSKPSHGPGAGPAADPGLTPQ